MRFAYNYPIVVDPSGLVFLFNYMTSKLIVLFRSRILVVLLSFVPKKEKKCVIKLQVDE